MADLTDIEKIMQNISRDETDMKGVIRPISRQRYCPGCGEKFKRSHEHINEGYACSSGCGYRPTKFYIDLWWKNRNYFLCSDKTGQPLDSYQRAKTLLAIINSEIQTHTFNPTSYTKSEIEKYFFKNQIEKWLHGKEKDKLKGKIAPSTLRVYRIYVSKYYIPAFQNQDVRDIQTPDVKKFYYELPDTLSLKYQKCLIDTLEQFFSTLADDDEIGKKPSFKKLKITVPNRTPKWIDRHTQDTAISFIEDERDKKSFIFLTRQGVRPSESRALKIKDINFTDGTVTVTRTFSDHEIIEMNKEKNIKARLLNPELIPMLKELCANRFPDEYVFVNWRTEKPYNRNIFNKIWNDACKKAGIAISLNNATRHSVGTQASRAGVPDSDIADILNHCDDRMVKKHYINKDDLEKQRVVFNKINNIANIRKKKKK